MKSMERLERWFKQHPVSYALTMGIAIPVGVTCLRLLGDAARGVTTRHILYDAEIQIPFMVLFIYIVEAIRRKKNRSSR